MSCTGYGNTDVRGEKKRSAAPWKIAERFHPCARPIGIAPHSCGVSRHLRNRRLLRLPLAPLPAAGLFAALRTQPAADNGVLIARAKALKVETPTAPRPVIRSSTTPPECAAPDRGHFGPPPVRPPTTGVGGPSARGGVRRVRLRSRPRIQTNRLSTSSMKSIPSFARATRLGSLVLLATGFTATSLVAGPGVQHWQSTPPVPAPAVRSAVPLDACSGCPGVKRVEVVVTRPTWPNARGPLASRLESREEKCRVCAGSPVALTPDWPNRRGPLKPVATPAAPSTQPVATMGASPRG